MMALVVLVPDVAVTRMLKRPSSSLGANPLVWARPSGPVRAVWVLIQPLNTPPGPAGGSWKTTSAPGTGLSLSSRTSTTGCVALRVRMLFLAPSPCTTTIFNPPGAWVSSDLGPVTCCAWHDRAIMRVRDMGIRKKFLLDTEPASIATLGPKFWARRKWDNEPAEAAELS